MTSPPDQTTEPGLSGPRGLLRALGRLMRANAGLLAGLALAVVGLEAGLRVLRPELAGQVYGPVTTGGHPIVFSDASFRIPEGQGSQIPPPEILALGDSTTFGTGVAAEETWPLQLGAELGWPVANAGSPGGGLRQLSHGLETLWSAPAPPVILVLVTPNMVSFTEFSAGAPPEDPLARVRAARRRATAPAGPVTRTKTVLQGSALLKAAINLSENLKYALGLSGHRADPAAPLGPLLAYGWQQPDLPQGFGPRMWRTFETELAALEARVEEMGSCLVLGFLPPRFLLGDRLGDNLKFVPKDRLSFDAWARVGVLAEARGLPFVDMTPALRQVRVEHPPWRAPLFVPNDYTHLDAQGHGIVAREFEEALGSCA